MSHKHLQPRTQARPCMCFYATNEGVHILRTLLVVCGDVAISRCPPQLSAPWSIVEARPHSGHKWPIRGGYIQAGSCQSKPVGPSVFAIYGGVAEPECFLA